MRSKGRRFGLSGATLLVTLLAAVNVLAYFLYREAREIVAGGLAARLEAMGRAALATIELPEMRDVGRLRRYLADLRRRAELENVFVFDGSLRSLADARPGIAAGQRYDRLQIDVQAVGTAQEGRVRVAEQYDVEGLGFLGAYLPAPAIAPGAVLYLESTVEYLRPLAELRTALYAAAGVSVVLVLLLVAAWILTERALARARAEAARAQRLAILGQMAAKVAHEIRNPLAIIRGSAELWREDLGPEGGKRPEVILDEVARLNALVDDFLALARESPFARMTVDLVALARETVDRFASVPREETSVRLAAAPASLIVQGDAARLRQVLMNLLRNACEAAPGGKVEVALWREGDEAVLAVRDDGPGISPEARDHLFEPFSSTKEGGTGLGLAVARQIVLRHGGKLEHVPRAGRGAEFRVRLPVG